METKRRELGSSRRASHGSEAVYYSGGGKPDRYIVGPTESGYASEFKGSQTTSSERHQWPPKGSGDVGGPFYSQKRTISDTNRKISGVERFPTTWNGYKYKCVKYNKTLSCPTGKYGWNPEWPSSNQASQNRLDMKGATAVSRCSPTHSGVELSTAVGELFKDGLPSILGLDTMQERTLRARNAGNEYLNAEFGWVPLVSDVKALAKSAADSGRILSQYRADRGNVIRRNYAFPQERARNRYHLGTDYPLQGGLSTGGMTQGASKGILEKYHSLEIDNWFSGAFVYGVPQSDSIFDRARNFAAEGDRLYGISLTPDVLWNLAPWSWAFDWISNTGDILANIGDFISQGLVMQYGYSMQHTVAKNSINLRGSTFYNGDPVGNLRTDFVVETKQRVRANPFGFGLTWDGLSATQGAILAALGISRY